MSRRVALGIEEESRAWRGSDFGIKFQTASEAEGHFFDAARWATLASSKVLFSHSWCRQSLQS